MPFLTPDTVSVTTELTLTVPDDPAFRAAVIGLLSQLVYTELWESFGDVSVDDTVAAAIAMLDSLSYGTGGGAVTPIYAEIKNTSVQSPSSGDAIVTYDTVVTDPSDMWDEANGRFVAPRTGVYFLTCGYRFDRTAEIKLWAKVNGVNGGYILTMSNNGATPHEIGTLAFIAAEGNHIEIWTNLNTSGNTVPGTAPGIFARLVSL